MSNVRAISTRATEVNESVVEVLSAALEKARAGEFNGIAIVGISPNGSAHTAWSENNDHVRLIGAVSLMLHHLHNMPTS